MDASDTDLKQMLDGAMPESVDDRVLEKEKASWDQIVDYMCSLREVEAIVTWDTMKVWLEGQAELGGLVWN